MKIFLDDIRDPYDNSWTVVRSYHEFRTLIMDTIDVITEISFDHDLGLDSSNALAPTGMHAVKWLMDYIMNYKPDIGDTIEKITVHSSNPAGAENIIGYCKSAKKHGILNPNVKIIR